MFSSSREVRCRRSRRPRFPLLLPVLLLSMAAASSGLAANKDPKAAKVAVPKPPSGGVKTPGVLIPAATLKSEAVLELATPPAGLYFAADAVSVADEAAIKRFELKTNKAFEPSRDVNDVRNACGGLLVAFNQMWTATCGAQPSLAKIDVPAPSRGPGMGGRGGGGGGAAPRNNPEAPKPPAAATTPEAAKPTEMEANAEAAAKAPQPPKSPEPSPTGRREGGPPKPKPTVFTSIESAPSARTALAASNDSLWLLADARTSLQRIDPQTAEVVADVRLPGSCESIVFAEGSLWVACPTQAKLLRIDPATNLVDKRIDVPAEPVSIAVGESSIWVLCRKEGKVARIDPKTNKVIATVELGLTAVNGTIAFGDGSLWASTPGFPVMRISPATDKVVQQFYGEGGGWVSFGGGSVWVGSPGSKSLLRFDPKRVQATLAE